MSRVVMFAEPADDASGPAPWIGGPHDTPTDRYYGFDHTQDNILPNTYQHVIASWNALGIPGAPISVDGGVPASGQKLVTSLACASPCIPHLKIVEDQASYEPTWRYLMGAGN